MIFSFNIGDYYNIIDEFEKKYESFFSSLKLLFVTKDDKSSVFAYGMRIIIPECHISIREGIIYDNEDESNTIEVYIVYNEKEKDPTKFQEVYSNTELLYLVNHYFQKRMNDNPKACIDEDEFVFWD